MCEDINELLVPARTLAVQSGNAFLVYLIELAQLECLCGHKATSVLRDRDQPNLQVAKMKRHVNPQHVKRGDGAELREAR